MTQVYFPTMYLKLRVPVTFSWASLSECGLTLLWLALFAWRKSFLVFFWMAKSWNVFQNSSNPLLSSLSRLILTVKSRTLCLLISSNIICVFLCLMLSTLFLVICVHPLWHEEMVNSLRTKAVLRILEYFEAPRTVFCL